MQRTILNGVVGASLMLALISPQVEAQETTEQFIPIGQSPGVSSAQSYIGAIADVDANQKTLTTTANNGGPVVKITERTRIWIDRSKRGAPSVVGGIKDLEKGRRIEIKYEDAERRAFAEWIKVEEENKKAAD